MLKNIFCIASISLLLWTNNSPAKACCPQNSSSQLLFAGFDSQTKTSLLKIGEEHGEAGGLTRWEFYDEKLELKETVSIGDDSDGNPWFSKEADPLILDRLKGIKELKPEGEYPHISAERIEKVVNAAFAFKPLTIRANCSVKGKQYSPKRYDLIMFDNETKNELSLLSLSIGKEKNDMGDSETTAALEECRESPTGHVLVVYHQNTSHWCGHGNYQRAFFLQPGHAQYLRENIYGFRLLQKKDYAAAKSHFERSLELNKDYPHANFNLACLLSLTKRPFNEVKPYLDLLAHRPDLHDRYLIKIQSDPDLAFWRSNADYGDWLTNAEAIPETMAEELRYAYDDQNDRRRAWADYFWDRAFEKSGRKDFDGAIADLRTMGKLSHLNSMPYIIASFYMKQGKQDDARTELSSQRDDHISIFDKYPDLKPLLADPEFAASFRQ